jgi:hypothetical protein
MDIDVDGAPNAYGPPNLPALDNEQDAHYLEREDLPIVGYLLDHHHKPIVQGPQDPCPGYYISPTAFEDASNPNERDPNRYVDATKINYLVRGGPIERRHHVQVGDYAVVYSTRTHKSVYAIVGDTGNPTGEEASLHLFQALGYPFENGTDDAIRTPDLILRIYPNSNPTHLFPHTQQALDQAAEALHLSRDFSPSHPPKD